MNVYSKEEDNKTNYCALCLHYYCSGHAPAWWWISLSVVVQHDKMVLNLSRDC